MTKVEYLKQVYSLHRKIQLNTELMLQCKSLAENGQAPHSEGGGGGGMTKSFVESQTVRYISLKDRVIKDTETYNKLLAIVESAIHKLDNPDYEYILSARYLMFKSWKDISESLGFVSESVWVYKLHKRAVEHISLPVQ